MEYIVPCKLKINLSLRILGRRNDGFHDLCSLFLTLKGPETLTLRPVNSDNVKDRVIVHNENIFGENILEKTVKVLRENGLTLPPLEINLWKQIPPGSGLGGGSGNAASLVGWAEKYTGSCIPEETLTCIGADVPFLCRTSQLSLMTGIGDIHEDLPEKLGLIALVLFPRWSSPTARAYSRLDDYYNIPERPRRDQDGARNEALGLLERLNRKQRAGLMPNDFTPVLMNTFPQYEIFFNAANASGSLGYGITGSGSACFALFEDLTNVKELFASCRQWAWTNKILVLE